MPGARPRSEPAGAVAILAAAAAFSLGVGLYLLIGRHEMYAFLGYDDGVWFGSSVRIAHGVVPYRSFVMDQPPGVPLLMTPFALASRAVGTREAFGAARLAVPCVGAVTVGATGWLVRHRGRLAVAVSSAVAAIYPEALADERTVMLEPFCAAFCLLGLVAVFDGDRPSERPRRLVLGGVAFGVAGSCKAFALLPFVVVLVVLAAGRDRVRRLALVLAGAAGAVAVVCGPFVVLAPGAFFHQVIAVQLGRSEVVEPQLWDRVFSLVGLFPSTGHDPVFADDSHLADLIIVAAAAAVVVGGWLVAARRRGAWLHGPRRRGITPLDVTAVMAVLVIVGGLVHPAAYYPHYAAFFAPFLAVSVGLAAGQLGGRWPRLVAASAIVALVAGGVHAVHSVEPLKSRPYEASAVDAVVPPGACVVSDDASVLILADRFTARGGHCPQLVDAFGTTLDSDQGYDPRSAHAAHSRAVTVWEQVLAEATYVVLTQREATSVRIPWTSGLRLEVRREFRTVQTHPLIVLERRST